MKKLSECTILVVDDTEANIEIISATLGDEHHAIVPAFDGETALELVESNPPDLILLDIMMPKMDGYEVCRRLKANEATRNIPIIFVSALSDAENESKGLELGAVDYISKPFKPSIVKTRVHNHLELKRYRDHLEELVRERTRELALTQEVTIESMAALAEYRDPETGGHIRRTQNYVRALAEHLKDHPRFKQFLDDAAIDLFYKSAPLHDIGKVGVSDNILLKPGKLTGEEFEEIKKHPIYGRDAIQCAEKRLGSNSFLRLAWEIAYSHHEKWDGSGYPQGLKKEEIPISGRLMALADVYDALISKRVYKPPFPHKKAVAIIVEGKGQHFDPEIVDVFLELEEQFRQIALKHADYEEERQSLIKGTDDS